MEHYGPETPASQAVMRMKYLQHNETFRDACNRVAWPLADGPDHYHSFRRLLLSQRFLTGGRIMAATGTSKATTAFNCFVSGQISDSFVSGEGNIMQRAAEAAATMRMGGGIGYDFSTLRPRGDMIRGLQSHSSGPVSFMEIFNAVGLCIASSGHRRGAQMGVLRVDHPDIEEFIHAKHNTHKLTGFNISIAVTDTFMEAVKSDNMFELRFEGTSYRTIRARELWEKIMRSTWDWAEPGVIFIDRMNAMNNLHYAETIFTTNPCSEQPLPPYGACLLGSVNLVKYLVPISQPVPAKNPHYSFDMEQLAADIPVIVTALDNVVDDTIYPLPEQEQEAKNKRRMGIGITGLANTLAAIGLTYGSEEAAVWTELLLQRLNNEAYRASAKLAARRGAFPMFRKEPYLDGRFVQNLDPDVRDLIAEYGIRNSHLTSIAPTGTISFCADNVSSGIEPVFSHNEQRIVNTPEGPQTFQVQDYAYKFLGIECPTANDLDPEAHVRLLTAAARWVDSSVSKTVNVPNTIAWEDFKDLYMQVYEAGGKSCATYTMEGKRPSIRTEIKDCSEGECAVGEAA
ncbi:adenosylcobalamin-dependent ribonucleoside-diphosphate reductase [Thiohalocapsa sp.]|uniref:adenosylcobalamin-dependent ribonucleoside-diphosphate reductase n=1 Tax=Thiohalocapsa sp. TaxID=2497641 RepID=UPI0025F1C140|nr:adenosylcobalamin-dependent ribonucleoside-diphosphate reductase [Thiohalocapsa sp.]